MSRVPGAEKRRHHRKAKKLLVKYRVIAGPGHRDSADRTGQVLNVSQSGIYLVAERKLPLGTVLDVIIPDNVFAGGSKTLRGIVRRIDLETVEGTPLGLMFVKTPVSETASSANPEKQKPAGEKRQHPRMQQRLIVRFRCVSSKTRDVIDQRQGYLMNISKEGMELWTRYTYPPGTRLEVHIPKNPLGEGRKVLAKVAWTKSAETEGWNRLGMFIEISIVP